MPTTKVINKTGTDIILKEGTAGVFRLLCRKLENDKAYNIKVDTNATFREYWCAVKPNDDNAIVLSSDDCMEFKEVRVRRKDDNTYTWDAVKRGSKEKRLVQNAGERDFSLRDTTPEPSPKSKDSSVVVTVWKKFTGFF